MLEEHVSVNIEHPAPVLKIFNFFIFCPNKALSSLLDVILASDTKQVEKAKVLQCPISDHNLVYVTLPLKKHCTKTVFTTPTVVKKL